MHISSLPVLRRRKEIPPVCMRSQWTQISNKTCVSLERENEQGEDQSSRCCASMKEQSRTSVESTEEQVHIPYIATEGLQNKSNFVLSYGSTNPKFFKPFLSFPRGKKSGYFCIFMNSVLISSRIVSYLQV